MPKKGVASKPDQKVDPLVGLFGRFAISKSCFLLIAPKLHQSRNSKIENNSHLPNLVEKLYSKFKAKLLKNVGCETLFDKSC